MPAMQVADLGVSLLRYRLARPVGGSGVASVDVLIARVTLATGHAGLGFSYVLGGGGAPALVAARALAEGLQGGPPLHHPEAAWRAMCARLNRTRHGPNFIALAALDVALWDAYANALGVPLGVAMGGAPRAVPVYGSGGFHARQSPDEAAAAAREHAARGFRAVKPRVACTAADAALIAAVREAVPGGVAVMVDANEKGTAASAYRLCAMARDAGVLFVEEPLPSDDVSGHRRLAAAFGGLAATGEHLQGIAEALPYVAEGLCSVLQPDLAMVGGLTGALRFARLAESFGVEIAPHFLPGLFVHLAAAAPNVTWLEDFPLLEPLFSGWPTAHPDGTLAPCEQPGHGLALVDGAEREFGIVA